MISNYVDADDMIGQYSLPLSNDEILTEKFDLISADVQDEVLTDLLGYQLLEDFEAGVIAMTPKWLNLQDGDLYDVVNDKGVTVKAKWRGLKDMLTPFVYARFLKKYQSSATQIGEMEEESQNANRVGILLTYVEAYNDGLLKFGIDFTCYSKYVPVQSFPRIPYYYDYVLRGSAFGFITARNEEDPTKYPNWYFTELKKANVFNI